MLKKISMLVLAILMSSSAFGIGLDSQGFSMTGLNGVSLGSLIQSAGVVGAGGLFNVGQVANGVCLQLQAPSLGIHTQDLNANLYQNVLKSGSDGTALGLQTFLGVQTQLSCNLFGGVSNIQGIGTTLNNVAGAGQN